MECALFGNYLKELNDFLAFRKNDGAVVIIQFARVKPYNGKIVLQNSIYRIKLGVIDEYDSACFMIFDNEAKHVLGKSCAEILDPLLLKGDLWDTPQILENLIEKTFLFVIEVQISDNPHFKPSYKVRKMTDDLSLINKFKDANPISTDVVYSDDLLPSSFIETERSRSAKASYSKDIIKHMM
ncbi:hypothetical protein PIB30_071288 [Stylosanthes scabra]|uniref:Uncharacterized protein n=1 Tax=Stylosanthes scabra TaxID=79078 RepID=A0ABU6YMQ9_9FABA|nr:hypothetical protein [Stylosanthes scabra]